MYRIFFKSKLPKYKKRLLSISLLTTFSQLSAEREGRHYGSGVLKLEPSEAKEVLIYAPETASINQINKAFNEIDSLLKDGHYDKARENADHFIYEKHIKQEGIMFLGELQSALEAMRKRRHR